MKQEKVKPIFDNKNLIFFSTNNAYYPYLAVTLHSLKVHSNENQVYDIVIIEQDLSIEQKKLMVQLYTSKNVSIRFFNIKSFLINFDNFYLYKHFSIETYFRFYIQQIFEDYNKIIYCDCDAVFLDDIAHLYSINFENEWLAAVKCVGVSKLLYLNNKNNLDYFNKVLALENCRNYFQAGLLIFNMKELVNVDFLGLCLETVRKIPTPKFVDQCILNVVAKNHVKFLETRWNIENHLLVYNDDLSKILPDNILQDYNEALKNPAFLHFSGGKKPWTYPDIANAEIWWKYARQTPFYEGILQNFFHKTLLFQES